MTNGKAKTCEHRRSEFLSKTNDQQKGAIVVISHFICRDCYKLFCRETERILEAVRGY